MLAAGSSYHDRESNSPKHNDTYCEPADYIETRAPEQSPVEKADGKL